MQKTYLETLVLLVHPPDRKCIQGTLYTPGLIAAALLDLIYHEQVVVKEGRLYPQVSAGALQDEIYQEIWRCIAARSKPRRIVPWVFKLSQNRTIIQQTFAYLEQKGILKQHRQKISFLGLKREIVRTELLPVEWHKQELKKLSTDFEAAHCDAHTRIMISLLFTAQGEQILTTIPKKFFPMLKAQMRFRKQVIARIEAWATQDNKDEELHNIAVILDVAYHIAMSMTIKKSKRTV